MEGNEGGETGRWWAVMVEAVEGGAARQGREGSRGRGVIAAASQHRRSRPHVRPPLRAAALTAASTWRRSPREGGWQRKKRASSRTAFSWCHVR